MEKEKIIKEFLEFRQQFTKREWFDLNRAIDFRLNEKADKLELTDFDIEVIAERTKFIL